MQMSKEKLYNHVAGVYIHFEKTVLSYKFFSITSFSFHEPSFFIPPIFQVTDMRFKSHNALFGDIFIVKLVMENYHPMYNLQYVTSSEMYFSSLYE